MLKIELGDVMSDFHKTTREKEAEDKGNFTILEKHEQFYTVKNKQTGDIYTVNKEEIIKPLTAKEIWQMVPGIIFVIWFIGSLGAMCYLGNIDSIYLGICIGQYFLVFGLVAVFNKVWPGLIFALVGLVVIVVAVLMLNEDLAINWDFVFPILFLSAFMLVGLGLMFVPTIINIMKKKKTSLKISGKVMRLDEAMSDGIKVYAPVYEYYFNGKNYQVEADMYSNLDVPNIGDVVDIRIDPNKPDKIYVDKGNKSMVIILFIMGIMFVFVSGISLYLFLFKN